MELHQNQAEKLGIDNKQIKGLHSEKSQIGGNSRAGKNIPHMPGLRIRHDLEKEYSWQEEVDLLVELWDFLSNQKMCPSHAHNNKCEKKEHVEGYFPIGRLQERVHGAEENYLLNKEVGRDVNDKPWIL